MKGSAAPEDSFVSGNVYDKYRTANPVARHVMRGFLVAARELVEKVGTGRVLEVGCGPGDLAASLFPEPSEHRLYLGTDLSVEEVTSATIRYPDLRFGAASADHLPFPDRSFDLVVACEVLEHLEDPRGAVAELARVCRGHLLASVPWEPTWRLLNLLRGAYLRQLGNTPGHLQHFSRRHFRRVLGSRFEILDERRPLPWTMVLGRVRDRAGISP